MATEFLSCDWGTTAFRLKLVELPGLRVLAARQSDEGNAALFERWQQSGQPENQRLRFYLDVLRGHVQALEQETGRSLEGMPVVVSGMASSTIGMRELPYRELPFAADGSDLVTEPLPATADFPYPVLLVSGARSADDVMRGEETQLVGCGFEPTEAEQLFLHPGTHAKHVVVRGGQALRLTTYMTGELFSLLSTKSLLAASVEAGGDWQQPAMARAFAQGVQASQQGSLLHAAFLVRTNKLFNKLPKAENFYYLSGLLIGAELRDFPPDFTGPVVMAGEDVLLRSYAAALVQLGIADRLASLTLKGAEEVTLQGQATLLRQAQAAGRLSPNPAT